MIGQGKVGNAVAIEIPDCHGWIVDPCAERNRVWKGAVTVT
jgi:hypothetical protein